MRQIISYVLWSATNESIFLLYLLNHRLGSSVSKYGKELKLLWYSENIEDWVDTSYLSGWDNFDNFQSIGCEHTFISCVHKIILLKRYKSNKSFLNSSITKPLIVVCKFKLDRYYWCNNVRCQKLDSRKEECGMWDYKLSAPWGKPRPKELDKKLSFVKINY